MTDILCMGYYEDRGIVISASVLLYCSHWIQYFKNEDIHFFHVKIYNIPQQSTFLPFIRYPQKMFTVKRILNCSSVCMIYNCVCTTGSILSLQKNLKYSVAVKTADVQFVHWLGAKSCKAKSFYCLWFCICLCFVHLLCVFC